MIAVFFPSVDFSGRTAVNVTVSNKFVLFYCHCVFIFLLHSYFASVLWLAKAHDDQIGSLLIKNFKDKMFVFTDQLQTPVLVLLSFSQRIPKELYHISTSQPLRVFTDCRQQRVCFGTKPFISTSKKRRATDIWCSCSKNKNNDLF